MIICERKYVINQTSTHLGRCEKWLTKNSITRIQKIDEH